METKRKVLVGICIALAVILALLLLTLGAVAVMGLLRQGPEPVQPPQTTPTQEPTTLPPPVENTLGPEDFIYENGFLTCTAAPCELGVDVSSYQGNIDWQAIRDAGATFAIIRVAGRGYGQAGGIYEDKLARINYEGAKRAGLKVGVYFFSQAITTQEAVEEARYILDITRDWDLQMPVVYDWERMDGDTRTANTDRRTVTDCMLAFCEEVEKAGRTPMVYFNPEHAGSQFYIEEVTRYKFWLAFYTDWMTFPYEVNMWQYTSTGKIPGVEGTVDLNLYFPESIKN